MASLEEQYAQRQAEAQNTYNTRQAENQRLYDTRQAEAQQQLNQRNAEAQNTYDTRLGESQGKISDMYGKALEAQKLQYQTALDEGIRAQEEARGGIAKSYQTAANDLAVQYERNKRNLNAQALARGLNTGTGSQQQLAVNQAFSKSMGGLRAEEAAQNAGIDRSIANLKIDYQANIAKAMADNDYKKAAALMEDYNDKLNWLDNQKLANQNRFDTLSDYNRGNLDSGLEANRNRLDTAGDQNRNWLDTETRYQQQQALERAETLASYGDFSGYAAIYGAEQAAAMREMWIAQNPLLAYNTGAIGASRYRALTGEDPPGAASSGGGGGGGGGSWGGSPSTGENGDDGNSKGNEEQSYLTMIMKAKQAGASNAEISKAISADDRAGSTGDYKAAKGTSQAQQSIDIRRATGTSVNAR